MSTRPNASSAVAAMSSIEPSSVRSHTTPERLAAALFDIGDDRRRSFGIDVDDDDVGALIGEQRAGGAGDRACPTGDDGDPVAQQWAGPASVVSGRIGR
jgi:hypothetical protein